MLRLKTAMHSLSWQGSLDIVIIALGLYLLYRTLRATGTVKVVTGIVIAAFIFIAADFLGLRGITWIYSNLSSIVLIAIIIIFQPEIRKILERTASIYRKETQRESGIAGLLADSVVDLAERRWGALIVLPGREPIESHLFGGTIIDGVPSFPLIESLFDPHSRGHDGAMVIQNGRAVSFGVRLPISASGRLSEEFGTRHHAAMGLSEEVDALILLVSEERGWIALFKNGAMSVARSKSEISSAILDHWGSIGFRGDMREKKARRWIVLELFTALLLAATIRIFMVPADPGIRYEDVRVEPQLIGEFPENIQLDRIAVTPPSVKIFQRTPYSPVELITSPIYLSNISQSVKLRVSVLAPPDVEPVVGKWPEAIVEIVVHNVEPEADTVPGADGESGNKEDGTGPPGKPEQAPPNTK